MRYRIHTLLAPLALLSFTALTGCMQPQSGASLSAQSSAAAPDTLNVADAAIAGGDPNMALSVTQSVLKTDPNNVDALIHEGDAYYALNRCPAAEAAYQLALQGDPKSTAAETGLGRCLLKTDPPGAEAALLLAVHDDPGNAAAYNDLGISDDLQSNFTGAADAYQHALIADPAQTATEVNLGLSLALSGNATEALQYLGPLATGQSATPKIREDYAAALVASGRLSDARQVLSIDLPPDKIDGAIAGFQDVIQNAQPALPAQEAQAAPPPTMPSVATPPVAAAPLAGSQTEAAPPLAAPPVQTAQTTQTTTLSYIPDNSTGAYVGPSPIPVTASSSEGVTAADSTPVAPAQAPVTSTPVKTASVAAARPPAAVAAVAPAETSQAASVGAIKVQLGALNSQADAERAWSKVAAGMPALFGDKQPDIENAVVNGKTFYRLRTGGFSSEAEAEKFCGQVSAGGNSCTIARF